MIGGATENGVAHALAGRDALVGADLVDLLIALRAVEVRGIDVGRQRREIQRAVLPPRAVDEDLDRLVRSR